MPPTPPPFILLIDFGLSAIWQPGRQLATHCGTLTNMPPEIVQVGYFAKPRPARSSHPNMATAHTLIWRRRAIATKARPP
eukprot:3322151-Prymnesium_polylepis.1